MFKKKASINAEKIDTLIGEGSQFTGKISASGIVRVDGKIEGEIFTEGDLIVGEKGKVKANLKGKNITVAGEIYGDIECNGKLELLPTAKLVGDIKVSDLFVDSGATFLGNCKMNQDQVSSPNTKESDKEKGKESGTGKAVDKSDNNNTDKNKDDNQNSNKDRIREKSKEQISDKTKEKTKAKSKDKVKDKEIRAT